MMSLKFATLCAILLDSGADSAIFPARFAGMGTSASCQPVKLHDAQGTEIPILDFRDIEVQFLDETGRGHDSRACCNQ